MQSRALGSWKAAFDNVLTALHLHDPRCQSQVPAFKWSLLALWSLIPLCSLGWCLSVFIFSQSRPRTDRRGGEQRDDTSKAK